MTTKGDKERETETERDSRRERVRERDFECTYENSQSEESGAKNCFLFANSRAQRGKVVVEKSVSALAGCLVPPYRRL